MQVYIYYVLYVDLEHVKWQPEVMVQDYGQVLKACAKRAQWALAFQLLNDLKLASIISNIILYSTSPSPS